ncbi:MAG: hypothetical protein A2Y62_17390 [Candidatus Fischerbacteria bacterium RBG_13_37_8]|uniref:Uncharacterized protein n=1 Tax=Candidatus Fischerbacteria bacterium RBG_13_37_8 TaxID=1817863 RepID=A0A1F5VN57_9BACT|nr:MAG: hypothetical protein A2Y62_17390 [Candidatus Fischerbacteria bacterium RBG_13_37_8]
MVLHPDDQKAIEYYQRWESLRQKLGTMLTRHGNLKLMLTNEQLTRDFTEGPDGLLPITKEGADLLKVHAEKAIAAAKAMNEEARKIYAEIQFENAAVNGLFWSLMPVHGLNHPVLSADGTKLFFTHSLHAGSGRGVSIYESVSPPLDCAEICSREDVYCWDLVKGGFQAISVRNNEFVNQYPACSANGNMAIYYIAGAGKKWRERNIVIYSAENSETMYVLGEKPLIIENLRNITIENNDRIIMSATISADGKRIVFLYGTYINLWREEGIMVEDYFLVLYDTVQKKAFSITSAPISSTGWPVIAGDGSTVIALTSPDAFTEYIPRKTIYEVPKHSPSPSGVYLIPAAKNGVAPKKIPLPDEIQWKSIYERRKPPFSLSHDGKKAVIETIIDGIARLYYYNDDTEDLMLINMNDRGDVAAGRSGEASISGDGRYVIFCSDSTELWGAPSENRMNKIYLFETGSGQLSLLSKDTDGNSFAGWCELPDISYDGRYVSFICCTEALPGTIDPQIQQLLHLYPARRLYVMDRHTGRITGTGAYLHAHH